MAQGTLPGQGAPLVLHLLMYQVSEPFTSSTTYNIIIMPIHIQVHGRCIRDKQFGLRSALST